MKIRKNSCTDSYLPHFANTPLYDVLFVRFGCECVFGRWEIYSFFGGGEKGEGKSSFADVAFGAGLAACKCAFSFVVALIVCFKNVFCRIYFHIVKIEAYIVPI